MTIKTSSQITISKVIDIYACYRYYKLQGSTLAKPTKPTKNPPDGWSDTEPAYISGSTNTLYFVDCNVYSDKTFSFSEVSKSSSYEAAKDAWNKANKAQDTATNAQNKVDNLQIGGRNLKLNGDFKKGLTAYGTEGDVNVSIENDVTYTKCAKVVFSTAYASERLYTTDYNNRYNLLNTVYTLSFVAKASSNLKLNVYRAGTAQGIGETNLSTEWKKFEMTYTATGTGSVTFKLNSAGTLYLANIKLELGNKATDWTPAPEDGIAKVDVEYYLSTSSTSLAGGSWTTIAPAWVNGKYMWSRTVTIDGAGNKTYSPNQNGVCITGAKGATGAQGPKGDTGAQGPKGDKGTTGATGATGATGNGVKSIVEQYYQSTSATSLAGGSWTTTYPGWVNGKYIWTRSVITYTSGSTVTTTPICVTGQKGDTGAKGDKGNTGATGAAGKGVKSTAIAYQASTSGVVTPTGTWSTTIPAVSAGSYLWTRTIITYTDNNTSTSYSVGKMGNTGAQGPKGDTGAQGPKGDKGNTGATGAAGKGIKSTAVTYQAGMTGVAVPTGTWSTTIPSTSASKPYLWSRTIITYTDNTTSTTYSVGSTADSVQIGGRNLVLNSTNLSKWTIEPGISISKEDEWFKVLDSSHSSQRWGIYTDIAVEPNMTYTLSVYCKNGNEVPYVGGGPMSKSSMDFGRNWAVSNAENGIRFITTITTGSSDNVWRFYLCVNPKATGQYVYFKLPKLEKGNKATDWTPDPEDLIKSITEANTAIEQVDEKISMKASTETVTEIANKANHLDKALTDAKTVIQQNSDAIASLTARDFKVEFTTITKQLETLNGDLSSYKEEIGNWMRFDAEGNLVLGATRVPGQDAYELKLTKNRISFMLNDDEVAYISNNELYITNSTVVQNLKIGRFVWEIRGNGNLGLIWR